MNPMLTHLLETIADEIKCYREIKAVIAKERDAATASDKDQLMRICQDKQAIVARIAQTEKKRQERVEQLALACAIQDRPLTITRLCASLPEPYAAELKTLASELKALVEDVQRENNANAKLFSQALELIHGSLKLINELIYAQAVYKKPGSENRTQGYAGDRGRVFCGSV